MRLGRAWLLLSVAASGQQQREEAEGADELATQAQRIGVMRVRSAQEFRAAMEVGVPHIVIEEHLDLTSLPTLPGNPPSLFRVDGAVQSIQVRSRSTCHPASYAHHHFVPCTRQAADCMRSQESTTSKRCPATRL